MTAAELHANALARVGELLSTLNISIGPLLALAENVLTRHRPTDYHGIVVCADHFKGALFDGPQGTRWPCAEAKAALTALDIEADT